MSTGFAPQIFDREHVKLLVYGAGPKIAWREKKWEPWAHLIVGGSHEQPQTAGVTELAPPVQDGSAPLSGLRVLDLSAFVAAPAAARTLAEFGAEKVYVADSADFADE